MAHPYSSTPLYAGTPSYAPHQQSYYPSYPSNGLQQQNQTLTSPALPQQPAQGSGQGQPQPFSTYQQQPPSLNGPTYEQNSQIPPSGPFPPFPPPVNFNPDFFKHLANAGFPPPPLPNLPPMPIPSPGYPQLHASVNTSSASPFPQYHTAAAQGYGSSFAQNAQNEQLGQHGGNQYMGPQQVAQSGVERQRDTHKFGAPTGPQSGSSHNARPVSRGIISLGNDKGRCEPLEVFLL